MDISSSSSSASDTQETQKRKAPIAGLKPNGTRPVKRRASKACQCCRARKVRCNVVEHGAPCTNCRLDEVDCVVAESKRRRKIRANGQEEPVRKPNVLKKPPGQERTLAEPLDGMTSLVSPCLSLDSGFSPDSRKDGHEEHVPHSIYQFHHRLSLHDVSRRNTISGPALPPYPLLGHSGQLLASQIPTFSQELFGRHNRISWPDYVKPLPPRIGPDEIAYLEKKGALTIPWDGLRNELLRSYVEFVDPYMPVLDLNEFLETIEAGDGSLGQVSLLLLQAVMFTGVAFVDMRHLTNAGYASRRQARKDFFRKAKLLYDFDYESDRISLVQALLLMTFWYESPDDQKDTWHWMGVATSLAHTIGLHRNPARSTMDPKRQKLWKRVWWSLFMRDRMIALGMRRPTRIKSEDCDVPMLTLDDYGFEALPKGISCISEDCRLARDVNMQRQLATMCVAKAQLCVCISHILSVQYSIIGSKLGSLQEDGNTKELCLVPKQPDAENSEDVEVEACDSELEQWLCSVPEEVRYKKASPKDLDHGASTTELHRALLHMLYYTTLSALHRPRVLPSTPAPWPAANSKNDLLDKSRRLVRHAAAEITAIAINLLELDLVRYLPTVGVTVLLPAIIIHLLDIKAPNEEIRRQSLQRFCQCMQVMGKLRDNYASADYSTAFLEAAIKKAEIQVPPRINGEVRVERVADAQGPLDGGRRTHAVVQPAAEEALTPPPEEHADAMMLMPDDTAQAEKLEPFPAHSPPQSEDYQPGGSAEGGLFGSAMVMPADLERDFEALIDLDATGERLWLDDESLMAMQGESSGFAFDMDFMKDTNFQSDFGLADAGDMGTMESREEMTIKNE